MVQINGMEFATSIGVLFALKEIKGYKTLQETYKLFENANMDTMLEILRVAYNKQNKCQLSTEEFEQVIEEKNVGFVTLVSICQEVIEKLMFSGMSPEDIEAKKKFLMSQK